MARSQHGHRHWDPSQAHLICQAYADRSRFGIRWRKLEDQRCKHLLAVQHREGSVLHRRAHGNSGPALTPLSSSALSSPARSLPLQEDPKPAPVGTFTSKTRIREALAIAVAMGSTTIRLISCGTSVNYAYAIEPKLGSFNQQALQQLDYVLYAAREYGLRVILPLTDNYQ